MNTVSKALQATLSCNPNISKIVSGSVQVSAVQKHPKFCFVVIKDSKHGEYLPKCFYAHFSTTVNET